MNIWIDSWEIRAGDSLIAKIQHAVTGASGLLVVLSKASVESEWCKKELHVGLTRELKEKRTVVIPVLYEDCDIPLFLRDKLYADFRTNFDIGLQTVLEAIADVSNEWQGRIEEPEWHTDWAIEWMKQEDSNFFRLTLLQQVTAVPYSLLGTVLIACDFEAEEWYSEAEKNGTDESARREIMLALADALKEKNEPSVSIENQMEVDCGDVSFCIDEKMFIANFKARRLGRDNGLATVFHLASQVVKAVEKIREATSSAER